MKYLALLVLLAIPGWSGAKYKLAYNVKANELIRMVATAADLKKWDSAGEEVQLEGSRVFVRGDKTGFILDLAKDELILLDHEARTYERTKPAAMKARIAEAFPPGVESILRRMFPANGKDFTEVNVTPTALAQNGDKKTLARFRAKYGLVYLLPGVDSIISFTPSIESKLDSLGKAEATPLAMRFAIGANGKMLDAEVRLIDYREQPIPAAVFEPPPGYEPVP
jgi:hypothetical protein